MCATAMIIMAATAAVTTTVQVSAANSAAKAQQNAARYQADIASNNAQIAKDQAQYDADNHDRDVRRMLASNKARVSGSGITSSGSALDVQMDNVTEAEMDKLAILYGGEIQSDSYKAQSQGHIASGKAARQAGKYAVGTSLLSGASQVAGAYVKYELPGGGVKKIG